MRWKGRPWSPFGGPSGTYDMRARVWSPDTGTFLSIDALGYHDPRGTLFSWPNQNPLRFSDPSGHWGEADPRADQWARDSMDPAKLPSEQRAVLGAAGAIAFGGIGVMGLADGLAGTAFGRWLGLGGSSAVGQKLNERGCSSSAPNLINPSTVRFSQDSAKATFRDGGSIKDLAAGLRNGSIDPNSVPPIRLVDQGGQLFSLDNRRLEAFRQAGQDVPFRMATPEEIANEAWKFTTSNGGESLRIRGE